MMTDPASLVDRLEQCGLIPMDELGGTKGDAPLLRVIRDHFAQLRQIGRGVSGIKQNDFGRLRLLCEGGMNFQSSGGAAEEDLFFKQFLNGATGGHVADAGLPRFFARRGKRLSR
jgi:hypothetical protein